MPLLTILHKPKDDEASPRYTRRLQVHEGINGTHLVVLNVTLTPEEGERTIGAGLSLEREDCELLVRALRVALGELPDPRAGAR